MSVRAHVPSIIKFLQNITKYYSILIQISKDLSLHSGLLYFVRDVKQVTL